MNGVNQYAIESLPTDAMYGVGMALVAAAMAASVLALVARYRQSTGVERQQIKWVALAAAIAAAVLPFGAVLWDRAPIVRVLIALALAGLPISMCVAILRYRLYDIDVAISRTVTYGAISVVLAAVYALTAVLLGTIVGQGSAWATAGATLVAGGAVPPASQPGAGIRGPTVRPRPVRRPAPRRPFPGRSACRAAPRRRRWRGSCAAWSGTTVSSCASFCPTSAGMSTPTDDRSSTTRRTAAGGSRSRGAGVTLGVVVSSTGTEPHPTLISQVLDAGGLAIEIARLRVELRRQLEEVEASRARIVAVADDERRRIERNLHDGAQQRLVSIGLALRHAQHELGPAVAPEAGRTLDGAVAEVAVAIDELRELAQGLRPSSLDNGLGAALRDLARRAPVPVTVAATSERFAVETETAAYFICCEGLTNAVKHARAANVTLSTARHNGGLVVKVTDDGIGGAVAARRLRAHRARRSRRRSGGTFPIDTGRHGTTLTARLPCAS